MIKRMGLVFTHIWMELDMKDFGKKINNMGKDRKCGRMELAIKESIRKGKSMVKELLNGLTMLFMLEFLKIIILKVMALINGQMAESIVVIG